MTRVPAFQTADPRCRVLFVTYGAGHIAKVVPVVRELERAGLECMVIALTIAHKKAVQMGLTPLGYQDFLPLLGDQAEAVLARGRALIAGNTHPDVLPHETCCYLGINYQEWVDELGEEGAAQRYAQRGRQGFMPVGFMGQILDALQPGAVVATSTPRSEEACIRAAVARGIPTLTMVDLFAPPSDPFLRRPVHADRITVISSEVKERFLAAGLADGQVVVTGSPDFDELFHPDVVQAGLDFRARKGWLNRKVILWAGILEPMHADLPGAALGTAVEEQLREWVRNHDDAALIVRYHPGQYHEFPTLENQECVHLSDPGSQPMATVLHASDVVIHQVSTVGLQAALLGKRVLHLEFSAWVRQADFDLSSLGPSEGVASLADLVPTVESSPSVRTTSSMTVPSGPVAGRVAAEVLTLLQKHV